MSTLKKQKVAAKQERGSKIFSPFRSLGNVCNHVPFAVGTLGTSFYIVTSIGKSFQIYDAATLHLLFVCQKETEGEIRCLFASFQYVYVGHDNCVSVYKRGLLVTKLTCEVPNVLARDIKIEKIIKFGDYLVAISSNNYIFAFKTSEKDSKVPTEFHGYMKVNEMYGTLNNLVHLPTHLNKVVVSTESTILVYNVRTLKLVHKSKHTFKDEEAITVLETPPVLDLVAIGTTSSKVMFLNVKKDKFVKKVEVSIPSKITSLSFRTDGAPHLAVGYQNGDLLFYNLNSNTRIHILHGIHKESGISNVQFLNGQPIFVTNGNDNHLREFVFDPALSSGTASSAAKKEVVPPPRHLRSRGGHSIPPKLIEFADSKDHFLISGAKESLWSFSLRKDSQAQEFSSRSPQHKSKKEKIPELVCMAHNDAKDWENLVTGHENEQFARTWSFNNKRLGRHKLAIVDEGVVKSVCISSCGNFAIVGSSKGTLHIYNLQSGILRKKYKFHKKAVTGIAIDNMNSKMCSVGLDGFVGFYDFNSYKFLGKIDLESPVTILKYHRSSDLIALALDDLTIVVIDVVTKKIVRQLVGHTNRITSLDFSPNGRWIVSSSLDGTVRTWNLPTGGCIDGFKLKNIVTNVKFSPTGNFLATTHIAGNGIFLWNNKSQFRAVSTRHVEEKDFVDLDLPTIAGKNGLLEGALEKEDLESSDIIANFKTVEQIDKSLLTLSLAPRSKFNTLVHLDTIKKRNKPKEAPKKPELAPFFLQTVGGNGTSDTEVKINVTNENPFKESAEDDEESKDNDTEMTESDEVVLSRIANDKAVEFSTKFSQLLKSDKYEEFLQYILELSPSRLDFEIKSLNNVLDPDLTEMKKFVAAISVGFKSNKNFEIYEALMNNFLRSHNSVIQQRLKEDDEFLGIMNEWHELSKSGSEKLDSLVKNCSGVINFLSRKL